ncbi:hypothetical protein R3P38DRAFT_3146395 [Favolaschia claudopus]|uniref:F-box domain-containing protein n=1 Tax=Favolaschia claudopus TaxID=2862362 RepID=A0AAV9Z2U5_9AGAR
MSPSGERRNPLEIQELLDDCIGLLHASTSALLACALVARSWVNTAQANLFRNPLASTPEFASSNVRVLQFLHALHSNPILARRVHELDLIVNHLNVHPSTLDNMGTLDFANLRRLYIDIEEHIAPELVEPLLSSPCLQYLHLRTPETFTALARVWECCSPTIRHFDLVCREEHAQVPPTAHPIYLKSLCLTPRQWDDTCPLQPRSRLLHPFDLSQLTAIAIDEAVSVPWDSICAENIEILDVNGVPDPEHFFGTKMDLTVLPNLRILRIQFLGMIKVGMLDCLAPIILAAPHLHTLVLALVSEYDNDSKAQLAVLESALLPLVLLACPVVEVAYWDDDFTENELKGISPQFLSRDMLRFARASSARSEPYLEDSWWHEIIRQI